jgi:hypothetical protein
LAGTPPCSEFIQELVTLLLQPIFCERKVRAGRIAKYSKFLRFPASALLAADIESLDFNKHLGMSDLAFVVAAALRLDAVAANPVALKMARPSKKSTFGRKTDQKA